MLMTQKSYAVWMCNAIVRYNLKVYMTDFFICSIKSPQCADKFSKNNFLIAIFLLRVLMCQKRQISLPVGYKTPTPKTGDWEQLWRQFRTPSLAKNRFLSLFYYLFSKNLLGEKVAEFSEGSTRRFLKAPWTPNPWRIFCLGFHLVPIFY